MDLKHKKQKKVKKEKLFDSKQDLINNVCQSNLRLETENRLLKQIVEGVLKIENLLPHFKPFDS